MGQDRGGGSLRSRRFLGGPRQRGSGEGGGPLRLEARWRQAVLLVGDLAVFLVALAGALTLRQGQLPTEEHYLLHAAAFLPLFSLWLVAFFAAGMYDLRQMRGLTPLLANLLPTSAVNWLLGTMFFYLLSPYLMDLTPKTHLLLTVLLAHAGALGWRRLWLTLLRSEPLCQRVVILGDEEHLQEVRADMERHPEVGFMPVAWDPGVDLVVADGRWVEDNWDQARPVLTAALQRRVPVVSMESFLEGLHGRISPHHAGSPAWMLEFVFPRSRSLYAPFKRAMDAFGAAALLLVHSPLILAVWAAIRFFDGKPVFFSQRRLGFQGREFRVWKFRTMVRDAERAGAFSNSEGDARVTPLGRILRRFRMDELPQLWNVLRGDMSLVGPRPEWVQEVEVIERVLPHYHIRHLVKPGITGWAQVSFRATNSAGDSMEKLHYDLYYVKHISFALDLSILLKTVKRVLLHDTTMPAPVRMTPPPPPAQKRRLDVGTLLGRE